ncbi:MAG: class I SAM-dependent methyltransferase [Acutalibacteraceae bacterium]
MSQIKLDARLSLIASLVKKDSVLIDIGTDHGYLPAFLVENGICKSAVACDVKEKPLENARKTVSDAGLCDKIQTVLSDGLDSVEENCGDVIVLAGMGGDLIANILSRCSWIKNKNIEIIAQPMTHAEQVRSFFINNGFEIAEEKACFCASHYYCVIKAVYTGKTNEHPKGYIYYGELLRNKDENSAQFLSKQFLRLKKRYEALLNSGKEKEECEYLKQVLSDFKTETENKYDLC